MKILIVTLLLLGNALAIDINVEQVLCNLTDLTAEQCASLLDRTRERIQENLPENTLKDYANGVANSTAFAVQGQGSDYGENFDKFLFKPSLGIAIQGKVKELDTEPEKADGLGVGAALTFGFNLKNLEKSKWGPLVLSRLDLFGSIMSYDIRQPFDEVATDGNLASAAFFGRYQIVKDEDFLPGHLLDWGGIHIHTGFQYSRMKLRATQSFARKVYREGLLEAAFNGGYAKLTLDSTTYSIPFEISTFFRLGYVFTLYTGFGTDLVFGTSDVSIGAGGSASGGITILDNDFQASFEADRDASGSPDATTFRGFAGLQFNLPYFRVYVHVNKAINSDLVGAHAGLKFVF